MNKAELIEALADKTGLQKQEAKKVLDAYIEIVTERMSENEEIVLVGFGTLIQDRKHSVLPEILKQVLR